MSIRRKRFSKVQLNQSLIIDTAIASLLVQLAPGLVNKFLFSSNPLTGMASSLAGVGVAYLYGMMTNNSNVSNIGIALGAVDLVKPMVSQLLPLSDENSISSMGDYLAVNDYVTLNEYTNNPANRLTHSQYADSY